MPQHDSGVNALLNDRSLV